MRLRSLLFLAAGIAGIGLITYSGVWYLILHHDPSQFIAFSLLGAFLLFESIVHNETLRGQDKINGKMDYFEDKLLDKFPELKGKETELKDETQISETEDQEKGE